MKIKKKTNSLPNLFTQLYIVFAMNDNDFTTLESYIQNLSLKNIYICVLLYLCIHTLKIACAVAMNVIDMCITHLVQYVCCILMNKHANKTKQLCWIHSIYFSCDTAWLLRLDYKKLIINVNKNNDKNFSFSNFELGIQFAFVLLKKSALQNKHIGNIERSFGTWKTFQSLRLRWYCYKKIIYFIETLLALMTSMINYSNKKTD